MIETKHFGVIENVVGNEGEGIGNLSVAAILDPSPMLPEARIIVGSTATSEVNLGQFTLTAYQANELAVMLWDAIEAIDRAKIAARGHDLIKTGDADSVRAIEDRNGEVALSYCRVCRKGEGELDATCPGAKGGS